MRGLILPAMRKLEDVLQFAGEGTGKIHTILREAEEEAARLFQALPEWDFLAEHAPPATDNLTAGQKEEFLADAVANWLLETYAQDQYGKNRQSQMNDIMRRLFFQKSGFPTGSQAF